MGIAENASTGIPAISAVTSLSSRIVHVPVIVKAFVESVGGNTPSVIVPYICLSPVTLSPELHMYVTPVPMSVPVAWIITFTKLDMLKGNTKKLLSNPERAST